MTGWLTGMQDWTAARDVLRLDLLGKLVLATILGGVIGWEREASGKAAAELLELYRWTVGQGRAE